MIHNVSTYGASVVAVFEDAQVIATCQPGWEDRPYWDQFLTDVDALGYKRSLSFDSGQYFPHADGSETYVIPRQR